jgi:pimeloyl-ACP methyl ester carboxylesterase
MRAALTFVLVVLAVIALALVGGWFALQRPDIPFATLQEKYGAAADRMLDMPSGERVRYRDQGDRNRPPLVLVHGYAASLDTWEPWVARLGERYRLISLDLPGHGLTETPAEYAVSTERYVAVVNAVADAAGLQTFSLAGSSMGGRVAWEYALAHSERLDALILVDAAGWPFAERRGGAPLVFQLLHNPVIGRLLSNLDTTALTRQGLQASFVNQAMVDDAMVNRYVEFSRAPGHRPILRALQLDYGRFATPDLLAGIAKPTLILSGEQDNLVPVAQARRFAAAIPGSELITFPNVGHLPQEEIPDASSEVVANFLARVYRSEPSDEALAAAAAAARPAP